MLYLDGVGTAHVIGDASTDREEEEEEEERLRVRLSYNWHKISVLASFWVDYWLKVDTEWCSTVV